MLIIPNTQQEPVLIRTDEHNKCVFNIHDAYMISEQYIEEYYNLFQQFNKLIVVNHDTYFLGEIEKIRNDNACIMFEYHNVDKLIEKLLPYKNKFMLVYMIHHHSTNTDIRYMELYPLELSIFYQLPIPAIRSEIIDKILEGLE